LPAPIQAALQEGAGQISSLWARARLRKLRREGFDEAEAVAMVVRLIGWSHLDNINRAEDWQPPGHGRRKPLPSPHMLANATMQTSGHTWMALR
jgi:hypothetical protein